MTYLKHVDLGILSDVHPEMEDLHDAILRHAIDCPDCKAAQIRTGKPLALCARCLSEPLDEILL